MFIWPPIFSYPSSFGASVPQVENTDLETNDCRSTWACPWTDPIRRYAKKITNRTWDPFVKSMGSNFATCFRHIGSVGWLIEFDWWFDSFCTILDQLWARVYSNRVYTFNGDRWREYITHEKKLSRDDRHIGRFIHACACNLSKGLCVCQTMIFHHPG